MKHGSTRAVPHRSRIVGCEGRGGRDGACVRAPFGVCVSSVSAKCQSSLVLRVVEVTGGPNECSAEDVGLISPAEVGR